ncbi:terminase [Sphingomonas oleivorans]|uniref:Terminase n=2 Tax=Sphingomonas oleivorans TaxID=1735121 RepID=A0A2T5G096_9SPHN|nr:terminase [Sphingomonas oleivorans]
MCEHLEAVTAGQISRLLINVPPGTSKSTVTGVFWPMWEWGPRNMPSMRYIGVAHEQNLGIRDNLKCRRLASSPWYQRLWGDRVAMTRDQNEKLNFENKATGFRQVATPGNITGRRGDRIILDDPLSAENANSEAERERVNLWFRESLPTRLNNPDRSAIVIVMQRLHERDLSGLILSERLGYEHLMLPMRYEPERTCVTMLGAADWRSAPGELLFPERFPAKVVDELERVMGAYATAGQHQQRPAPREGGLFKRAWFQPIGAIPAGARRTVRAWDLAATRKASGNDPDWTVGIRISRGNDGLFIIEGVHRFRGSPMEVDAAIRGMAALDGTSVTIRLTQDPGQAGKAQADTFLRALAGYTVLIEPATGDKATRATPAAVQAEAGNVRILASGEADRDAWIGPFLDEISLFPAGAHDDQVDAFADAVNALALGSTYSLANL